MSDLISSIKVSKLPIICICNDKYKQSLKSLRNHCLEIAWNKPTKQQVGNRLRGIAQAEGLTLNQVRLALKLTHWRSAQCSVMWSSHHHWWNLLLVASTPTWLTTSLMPLAALANSSADSWMALLLALGTAQHVRCAHEHTGSASRTRTSSARQALCQEIACRCGWAPVLAKQQAYRMDFMGIRAETIVCSHFRWKWHMPPITARTAAPVFLMVLHPDLSGCRQRWMRWWRAAKAICGSCSGSCKCTGCVHRR